MDTKTFLEAFHQNNKINFRALKEGQKPLNLNGYYNQYIEDKLKQLNEQGYNIYFTVNSGGTVFCKRNFLTFAKIFPQAPVVKFYVNPSNFSSKISYV